MMPSPDYYRSRNLHLAVGLSLFLIAAVLDTYFTLQGTAGNLELEANAFLKAMMLSHGSLIGIVIVKGAVAAIAVVLGLIVAWGIERAHPWVYWLALTAVTKAWMRRKKRRFVAWVPLYLAGISQVVAAGMWVYLFWIVS